MNINKIIKLKENGTLVSLEKVRTVSKGKSKHRHDYILHICIRYEDDKKVLLYYNYNSPENEREEDFKQLEEELLKSN